jgi:hypothetical protein
MSTIPLDDANWYDQQFKRALDAVRAGLWAHLDEVPSLEGAAAERLVRHLLELACQAQHIRNIVLGRAALQTLPRAWLFARIAHDAEPLSALEDPWAYLRLGEVYVLLGEPQDDRGLLRRLAAWGKFSPNAAVREEAQMVRDWLAGRVPAFLVQLREDPFAGLEGRLPRTDAAPSPLHRPPETEQA